MLYRMNPKTRQMWAASDNHEQGSGQALQAWALGAIQEAVQSGQLDPKNPAQLTSFLSSLGITPEKGGGRFLYNKLTGPESPLAGMRAPAATGGMPDATSGPASGPRPSSYSNWSGGSPMSRGQMSQQASPLSMGRDALMNQYGSGATLGTLASTNPRPNAFSNWSEWR